MQSVKDLKGNKDSHWMNTKLNGENSEKLIIASDAVKHIGETNL